MDFTDLFSSSLFDCFTEPVLLLDDTAVRHVNEAGRLLGLTAGMSLAACFGEDADVVSAAHPPAVLTLLLAGRRRTVMLRPAPGGTLLVASPMEDAALPSSLLSISNAMSKSLSNLAASISSLDPLLDSFEDPALRSAAASFRRALYQLLRLDGNLRGYGSALTGDLTLRREREDLCAFFRDLCARVRPLCTSLDVTLSGAFPARPIFAWIDRWELFSALCELLSCTLQYTPRGGTLRLELLQQSRTALCKLTCTGDGFDPAAFSASFQRITGVSPLDDSRSGDGLGVRVAQRVVELHGGRTLLETAAATATLCVSLPLTSPHPAATKLHSPATAPSPFAADSAAASRTLDRKVLTAFSSLLSKDYYNLSEKH